MKRILTILVTLAAFLAAESNADAQFLKNLFKKATTESLGICVSSLSRVRLCDPTDCSL